MIALSAQGKTTREQAVAIGVHHTTIIRNQRDPDIRSLIEQEARHIIETGLPAARKTIIRLATQGNDSTDKDMLKLALDASKHISSIAGMSGQVPSTIINQMIQINQAPEQSKELDTLTSFLQAQWDSKVIDVPTAHTDPADTDVIEVDQAVGNGA